MSKQARYDAPSPRGRERRFPSGSGLPVFVFYPDGSSGTGFALGSFSDGSRVGRKFEAAFGVKPSEAQAVPCWRPELVVR